MVYMLLSIPIITVAVLTSLPGCPAAFGCSCVEPQPPAEALVESKTVFSGKALSISSNEYGKLVTFDVDRAWKGISKDRVTASTPANSAGCGYEFEEGKEYLVYSNQEENALNVILCSRTQPLETASSDLAVLGQGYPPTQVPDDGNWSLIASPPKLENVHDGRLQEVQVGDELVMATTFKNNDKDYDWAAYFINEVRDSTGTTVLLTLTSGTIESNSSATVGATWVPALAGAYELRAFAITDLENPRILSLMSRAEVNIVPIDGTPNVTSFDECVRAGYPVMESFPRQCKTPDGRNFVEQINGQ
jgi:hypothetical protein